MLECRDIDSLMMDWLYEELEPSETADFDKHVGGCERCTHELDSVQRTRQLFSELPLEEPPAALTSILLHEAAKAAPAQSAGGEPSGLRGFFASFWKPIVLHPAASALATLILVAGVAGTLYVKKGDQMARPNIASNADAPEEASEATAVESDDRPSFDRSTAAAADPESPKPEPEPALPALTAPMADEDDSTVAQREAFAADVATGEQERALKLATSPPPAGIKPTASLRKRKSRRAERNGAKKKPAFKDEMVANAVSSADPLIALDGAAEELPVAGAAPVPTKPAPAKKQTKAYRPYDRADSTSRAGWVRSQEASLSQAVKDQRCRDAARIANDILDRDPAYYTKRLKNSKEVKKCQWYVRDETRRRSSDRRVGRSKKGKAGGGASRKAKAAEQPSEAAAEEADVNTAAEAAE